VYLIADFMHKLIQYDIQKNYKKYFPPEVSQNEIYNKYFLPLYSSSKEGKIRFNKQMKPSNKIIYSLGSKFV
jgi:hypothetical protein